jgi:hypothetical protein
MLFSGMDEMGAGLGGDFADPGGVSRGGGMLEMPGPGEQGAADHEQRRD